MKIINIFLYIIRFFYSVFISFYRWMILKFSQDYHTLLKKKILDKKSFFYNMHYFLIIKNFSVRAIFYNMRGTILDHKYEYYQIRLRHFVGYYEARLVELYSNNFYKFKKNISRQLNVKKQSRDIIVSIIIPTYKNRKKLYSCLASILEYNYKYGFEIIVIDDYNISHFQPHFIGNSIKCIKNKKNLGFIRSCNLGAKNAIGKYLYFLNDDTIIIGPETINSLIDRAESDSDIGLVGSKVLLGNSVLQEAGCLTFDTGDCWQYGKNDNQDADLYNYSCEVDYCSGCSLLIKKKLFDKIEFDEIYIPAYYEDVDLAFTVRDMGYKVVYEPKSALIHMEGSSSGIANTAESVKKYQYINKEKFYKKWKISIKDKIKKKEILNSKIDRPVVLIIDDLVPDENRDAGSLLPLFFIEYYLKKNCQIIFYAINLNPKSKEVKNLQTRGVFVIFGKSNFEKYTNILRYKIKHVIIFRINILNDLKDHLQKITKKIFFHYVDLHHLRLQRQYDLGLYNNQEQINKFRILETEMVRSNFINITCSTEEDLYLKDNFKLDNTMYLPLYYPNKFFLHEKNSKKMDLNDTLKLVFIGSYNHEPNYDVANYFVKKILPFIKKKIKVKLYLVGPDQNRIKDLGKDDSVEITGKIEDLSSLLPEIDIAISPLRYGAGNKGKILTYAMFNMPVICSNISVEGTIFKNNEHCVICDPEENERFADMLLKLFLDTQLKQKISKNLYDTYESKYSFDQGFKHLDADERFNLAV